MKQHPLLLSPPMVLAYLALRKIATRRTPNCMNSLVDGKRVSGKKWKEYNFDWTHCEQSKYGFHDSVQGPHFDYVWSPLDKNHHRISPIYQPGDWLWFKETWAHEFGGGIIYKANHAHMTPDGTWRPSIHMPKDACRLWAEVADVHCQRVQDITEDQAIAEGLARITKDDGITWKYGIPDKDGLPGNDDHGWPWHDWSVSARNAFATLWGRIHGLESWQANPPVYAISYKILSTTGKPLEKEKV